MTEVDPCLLKILVCPVTKGPLEYDRKAQELISRSAGLAYPVRNGIPIMLADEARPLEAKLASPSEAPKKSRKANS
ncbi:MAG: hypothetical protein K0R52_1584 [Alphaproteobacteria bacterium]|jgi:uncharacterized protein YbaR (Trm112 family)|nr:hypothetical protein [Alphaproteobacteria bacterium]